MDDTALRHQPSMARPTLVRLNHGRVTLSLHVLSDTPGPNIVLLHGLGERSPDRIPRYLESWPGGVYALDFTGHGDSDIPLGGGYTAEALVGDADTALARLGTATLLGRGLGAYIALMLAGARPEALLGVILADGPGIAGGGQSPGPPAMTPSTWGSGPPDPFALLELSHDVRPPELADACVRRALERAVVVPPLIVSAMARPAWLAAVANHPGVPQMPLTEAVAVCIDLVGSRAQS